jgi:hypothetical protein
VGVTGLRHALPVALVVALIVTVPTVATAPESDPLAAELARWSALVAGDTRTDPLWLDARKSSQAVLANAQEELGNGRRLVAIERLAAAGQSLGAALYAIERPTAERKDLAAFEAEWRRVGIVLRDVVSPDGGAAGSVNEVRPALVRALAEAATSQARQFYAASLDYGRNTEPQYGLYYLGAAQAQRHFLDLAPRLTPPSGKPPRLRALGAEIAALQGELLAAYVPPASVDRHAEFIVASAALKEARELDAAGYRYAALLRYLQAAQRAAMLRAAGSIDVPAVIRRLQDAAARLKGPTDHSVGRFFIERAHSARAANPGAAGDAVAAAVAVAVLPRYFAALDRARPAIPAQKARVTVTLVRWPFT